MPGKLDEIYARKLAKMDMPAVTRDPEGKQEDGITMKNHFECLGVRITIAASIIIGLVASAAAGSVTESVLYSFAGSANGGLDGSTPTAIVQASDGNFYGTTSYGGANNTDAKCSDDNGDGTLFRVTPNGQETILFSFGCGSGGSPAGGVPYAGLIVGKDSNLYGTSVGGYKYNAVGLSGTVFKSTLTGAEVILHQFTEPSGADSSDGEAPNALVQGSDGNFYGTTQSGGTAGHGTVFQVTPAGVETVLHTFTGYLTGSTDGGLPTAALIQASDGDFYGTTQYGGTYGSGTVFRITPSGQETILHSFGEANTDGSYPGSALVQGKDGNLYGTTYYGGGESSGGTVFQISPAGVEKVIYSFASTTDGQQPGKLILGSDGNFYGVTYAGGVAGTGYANGTVYRLTPSGTETVLHTFAVSFPLMNSDGTQPVDLIEGADRKLYGVTATGGAESNGTVFQLSGVISAFGVGGAARGTQTDYLGEGKANFTVWRPSTGYWYSVDGVGGSATGQWGAATDLPVVGDFDGDGKSDFAVYRPATGFWYIKRSSDSQVEAQQWGAATDLPVAGDFDGDGKTDLAVYRPLTGYWYITRSSDEAVEAKQFGAATDVPVVGDFDGDGKSDLAVYRPSTGYWYITQSSTNTVIAQQWGTATDVPVSADYDGDGKTDIAVYRPSTGYWYIIQSSNGQTVAKQFGAAGDEAVARDYDGDGKADIAVWRPSTGYWYVIESGSGQTMAKQWGAATDIPVNNLGR